MNSLEQDTLKKGRDVLASVAGEVPSVFSRRGVTGRVLRWSMADEQLRAQLFRLVDVLPSLRSSREVGRHAYEYLKPCTGAVPSAIAWMARIGSGFPWLAAFLARRAVVQMASNFILASSASEGLQKLRSMRQAKLGFTVDILGEAVLSEDEAERYQRRYLHLLDTLSAAAERWPEVAQLDLDDRGPIPRVNVSVKISALYSQIDPTAPDRAVERLCVRLEPLLTRAKEKNALINLDMESYGLKGLTLALFKRLLDLPALSDYAHGGVALQAYLRDSERDLAGLIQWCRERGRTVTVRLIKGAYWDYEVISAKQRGWPVPVFERKAETDLNFERLAGRMIENARFIRCAFGTHSVRSIASCLAQAERAGLPPQAFEFQMLYGMAEPIKRALIERGYRVRDYCPIGEILPGMSYLVRRLLENTSNSGFLRAAFSEHTSTDQLLQNPAELVPGSGRGRNLPPATPAEEFKRGLTQQPESATSGGMPSGLDARGHHSGPVTDPFHNEPHLDFTVAENRERLASALTSTRDSFGQDHPLIIGGEPRLTGQWLASSNPANPLEGIGRVARASHAEAEAAVAAARAAFQRWSRATVAERARVLRKTAGLIRQERFQFAALEILETGKNWAESDADVTEAIDFCNFYACEMERLAGADYSVPGETNRQEYVPRGVVAVIAPWNFPLAILCGMTVAAVVTGNTVVMKPAEQSSIVAARFMSVLTVAGVPPGVVNFLPGLGEEVGEYLVNHPRIALIAFTGSREVGLRIYEAAGRTTKGQPNLKKMVCEMGGKNALIIDSDADLDEAIPGVLQSAFGYQGQKCSALSRLILLAENHDHVVRRLVNAARCLQVGRPEDPGTLIGPLIDRTALERVQSYLELGKKEAEVAFPGEVPAGAGFYAPPTIFTNVPRQATIAREEIFGPVLCVLKAKDLEEAIALANDTEYALTGGFYSRSPANIERVKAELQVGNLYINRPMTGALVGRQPFGGFKMSGGGTQAGGPDYLKHFLFPRVITENQLRHGFAPVELPGAARDE